MRLALVAAAYNASNYLNRFFESLHRQTYQNYHLVFVDDCSTDGTHELAKQLAEKQGIRASFIRHDTNKGLCATRNTGLACAGASQSDYVSFLDVDDWFEESYLEDMVAAAEQYDADLVIAGVIREDGNTGKVLVKEMLDLPQAFYGAVGNCRELAYINPCSYAKLFRTACVKNIRFRDMARSEDTCFLFDALANIESLAFTNCAYYHYCLQDTSLSRNFNQEMHESMHAGFQALASSFSSEYPVSLRQAFESQVFIHSSVGGVLRRIQKGESAGQLIQSERAWLDANFSTWRTNPNLRFLKGYGGAWKVAILQIFVALYRHSGAALALRFYSVISRLFHKEVRV